MNHACNTDNFKNYGNHPAGVTGIVIGYCVFGVVCSGKIPSGGRKIISGMERSKWKSEGFMVTASDSSANTVPGERTGLGVLSFWGTTEKSRSGCQRVEKEEKKEKGTGAERTEKKSSTAEE